LFGFTLLQSLKLRRAGVWTACFALWLQLALSFGHIHASDLYGPLGHPVQPGHGADQLRADHPDADPGGSQGLDEDSGGCAICAGLHLAAGSVPPPSFVLPAVDRGSHVPKPVQAALPPGPAPHLLSRPRAPPAA
jgi:hypothetical protein